jgi:hypothetical protein
MLNSKSRKIMFGRWDIMANGITKVYKKLRPHNVTLGNQNQLKAL